MAKKKESRSKKKGVWKKVGKTQRKTTGKPVKKRLAKKKAARKPPKKRLVRKKTARKTAKAGSSRKKPTRKPPRKKATSKPAGKTPARKKTGTKSTKKQPLKKKTTTRKGHSRVRSTIRPSAREVRPPIQTTSLPKIAEKPVGVVTHYFNHLSVAVIRLDKGELHIGNSIHIAGHTTDLRQAVESMQVEHLLIQRAAAGQEFGLKVSGPVRENDIVYRVMG